MRRVPTWRHLWANVFCHLQFVSAIIGLLVKGHWDAWDTTFLSQPNPGKEWVSAWAILRTSHAFALAPNGGVTCKANKTLVLETAPIASVLAALVDDGKLVMLKADWTRPDPRIAAFLASHDRFGIPFNIIYGPKASEGVLLGELLHADMVEKALIKAGMVR